MSRMTEVQKTEDAGSETGGSPFSTIEEAIEEIRAGRMVIVCDGTPAAARRIERVLTNDPASGVMRHADAGYETAIRCAREQGLVLPMVNRE